MGLPGAETPAEAVAAFVPTESKLSPPQPNGQVARTALLKQLTAARSSRLILITAPAGYGKTTLLAQWSKRTRRPLAWVSLDRLDNDPAALMTCLATAVDRVAPREHGVSKVLGEAGDSIEASVVPRLSSAMAAIGSSFVLVLDDVHLIHNSRCIDALDALIEHMPPSSQLILAGRSQPSRRVPSMRVAGSTLELGPDDLRMDEREAEELVGAAGLELPAAAVSTLVGRAEGWAAGIYLGALSGDAGNAGGNESGLRGDDRFVADYLANEVFSELSDEDRQFLERTSVLERLSGQLCDVVLGSRGSGEILERLRRSNLFVMPLDHHAQWYRYHDLLREMLRASLERSEPDLIPELLARAADWFDANGMPEEAVAYAQTAGDVGRVWRLVATRAQDEYRRGRATTVEQWFEWLDCRDAPEFDPFIACLGAWFSALRGNPDRTERWADLAATAALDHDVGDNPQVAIWLALLDAVRCRRGAIEMLADATRAAELTPRSDPWWLTTALVRGLALVVNGDRDEADHVFADVAESAQAREGWNGASLALAERTTIALARDDWVEAESLAEHAEAIVDRAHMESYAPNALVFAVAARVAMHRQERDRADELLIRAQRLRPRLTRVLAPLAIQARLELACAYAARPDPAGARTLLREAHGLLRRGRDFGMLNAQAAELELKLETARAQAPGASTLTNAELRLLPLLPTQLSFREIGERLFLSRHTVKSQAVSIYRKLDVASRTEAVERARVLGLF